MEVKQLMYMYNTITHNDTVILMDAILFLDNNGKNDNNLFYLTPRTHMYIKINQLL